MEYVQNGIDWLLAAGPELLLFVVLVGLGYTMKLLPMLNNQWIPVINMTVGVGVYPLLRQPGSAPPWVPHPYVYFAVVGFIIFAAEWLCHNKVLKRIEDKLGLFDGKPVTPTDPTK